MRTSSVVHMYLPPGPFDASTSGYNSKSTRCTKEKNGAVCMTSQVRRVSSCLHGKTTATLNSLVARTNSNPDAAALHLEHRIRNDKTPREGKRQKKERRPGAHGGRDDQKRWVHSR